MFYSYALSYEHMTLHCLRVYKLWIPSLLNIFAYIFCTEERTYIIIHKGGKDKHCYQLPNQQCQNVVSRA